MKFLKKEEEVQHKDKEITDLKSRLEDLEGDYMEVIRLGDQVSDLETMAAVMVSELADIRAKNVEFNQAVHIESGLDSKLGTHISLAIKEGQHRGLEVGVVLGKAGKDLSDIESYDAEANAKYIYCGQGFRECGYRQGYRECLFSASGRS
ncbi:hypothetical protein Tco_0202163 [Tanacetum coccineum]